MAQDALKIERDPADPTKLNTGEARKQNESIISQKQKELDTELASKPSKLVNLRIAKQKTINSINELNITATEKKARIAELNELYNDEIINAGLNRGNPLMEGTYANKVNSSMWRLGYRNDKPTQKATARQFGHFIADTIKDVYKDTKVSSLLEELKFRNGITNLLENAHGKAIAGGMLPKQLAGITGSVVGSTLNIPVVGPVLGKVGGEAMYSHLTTSVIYSTFIS